MVAYITKDEREVGHLLRAIAKESKDDTFFLKMKKCGKGFLNSREVCAQEAAYRLLSIPLFKSNFSTVFVPADIPSKRISLLKPMSQLKEKTTVYYSIQLISID